MLSPQPKGMGAKDSAESTPNCSMNDDVNTQAQGNHCASGLRRPRHQGHVVGSAVITGGIYAEEQQ